MYQAPQHDSPTPHRACVNLSNELGKPQANPNALTDDRFEKLIGTAAWHGLPQAVRQRFSKDFSRGQCAVYVGSVVKTNLNCAGWLLARLASVLGSPLPRDHNAIGPAVVIVTQNPQTRAQNWIRTYSRPRGTMHTIASEKRFSGPTGLEEYVGASVGMTLTVKTLSDGLVFQSKRYFLEMGPLRLSLPKVLAPGLMTILHRDLGDGRFTFELTLEHTFFGRLLYQLAEFQDGA